MQDMDIVGQHIRERREQLGLTQTELAARMQVREHEMDNTVISKIETGHRRVLPQELIGFSRVLGVRISWLLGVSDDPRD